MSLPQKDSATLDGPQRSANWMRSATPVVVLAFGIRALLIVISHHVEDSSHLGLQVIGREAGSLAWSLASGKGYSNPFAGYDLPTAWLAPILPALWSLGFRMFDPNTSDGAIYVGQLMNSAFSAFICWPLAWLGARLWNRGMGLATAWAWALQPLAILFSLEWVWDQNLSALVLTLLLCATYRLREASESALLWSGYGCLWGFAALVNPALCILLPFLLAWIALGRRGLGLRAARPLFKSAALFVLCILPWTVRNYFVLEGLVFIKSNFGLEFWLGNNAQIPADDVYAPQLHPMNSFRELLPLVFNGEVGYMRAKEKAALTFIRSDPAAFLRRVGRRVMDTWTASNDSQHDLWMKALHLSRAEVWFCSGLSLVALAGVVIALWKNPYDALPLVCCVTVFPIPYYITHTTLRYRHPIDPVLTLLAVFAVALPFAGKAWLVARRTAEVGEYQQMEG